jgi:hypothetical protein
MTVSSTYTSRTTYLYIVIYLYFSTTDIKWRFSSVVERPLCNNAYLRKAGSSILPISIAPLLDALPHRFLLFPAWIEVQSTRMGKESRFLQNGHKKCLNSQEEESKRKKPTSRHDRNDIHLLNKLPAANLRTQSSTRGTHSLNQEPASRRRLDVAPLSSRSKQERSSEKEHYLEANSQCHSCFAWRFRPQRLRYQQELAHNPWC